MLLTDNLSSLQGKCSEIEFTKLWKKLYDSAEDLDFYYEESKEATFTFKKLYDEIQQAEHLNEALRFVYYDALSTKKKHEKDRDSYFQCDSNLTTMKTEFVEKSQELALRCSKYIEYSQRFMAGREELFAQFLENFQKILEERRTLQEDKQSMQKQLVKNRSELRDIREELNVMNDSYKILKRCNKELEEKRNQYNKDSDWMRRQNEKLKENIVRLEKDILQKKSKIDELNLSSNEQESREQTFQEQNNELNKRCIRMNELCKHYQAEILTLTANFKAEENKLQSENEKLLCELKKAKQQLDAARDANHKTIAKNQELREKLTSATRKIDKATKEKLISIKKENKTQKVNTELAVKQIQLIDEVLELKADFFRDQNRIREGARINRKLQASINNLQHKMNEMKENSKKIDPLLYGAKEYRKQLLRKFGTNQSVS